MGLYVHLGVLGDRRNPVAQGGQGEGKGSRQKIATAVPYHTLDIVDIR